MTFASIYGALVSVVRKILLDAKPIPDYTSRATTTVHYTIVPLLGAAIFEAIKIGRAWVGWTIP
jgi:hypothetical protein